MKKLLLSLLLFMGFNSLFAQQWELVETPTNSLATSFFAKDNIVMFIGDNEAYFSNDIGKNWTKLNAIDPRFFFSNSKKLFIGALNNIYSSSDNGKTWQKEYDSGAYSFAKIGDEVFVANGFKGILKHNNVTGKWETTSANLPMSRIWADEYVLYTESSKGLFAVSYDKGITWLNFSWPGNKPDDMTTYKGVTYICGLNLEVQSSIDSCKSYKKLTSSGIPAPAFHTRNAVGIDDSLFVAWTPHTNYPAIGVYRYDLKSKTWAARNSGLTEKNMNRIVYNGNGILWGMNKNINSTSAYLYKMNIGTKIPGVSVKDNILPSSSVTVAPNPCTSFLNISIDKGLNTNEVVKMEVLDIQGKSYKQINQFSSSINTEELPKGMYFLRCHFGKNISINKFIVE